MSDDLNNETKSWIDAWNRRGEFGRRNQQDRKIVETETAREWARSLKTKFNFDITDIRSSESDPPDCTAMNGNRCISIELAELVDQDRINARVKAVEAGTEPPEYHGEAFGKTQWTIDRFHNHLNSLLDNKHHKYLRRGQQFDVLLVHTGEPWLLPIHVQNWLSSLVFAPRSTFVSAFFIMTYDPSFSNCWPVFQLFGELYS